mmetsp:Transcript_19044/g.42459  ORF Transcript_19044/g.42459 Transcript_19044/m.42459 type:complete len:104 (-) Transcript_19044:3928-4239(-)
MIISTTLSAMGPHCWQYLGEGHTSPHKLGQRCPHCSNLGHRTSHGSLLQGAPQGIEQRPLCSQAHSHGSAQEAHTEWHFLGHCECVQRIAQGLVQAGQLLSSL